MNKSQRIYLNTSNTGNQNDNKFITVRLEQDVETLEFMSMTLRTKDVYQNFNADYGVLVGRVLANGGIGVPNAKISIFIPLTDEDASNPDTYKLYPYTTPRDKNTEGKRYNLLPRVSKRDPEDGEIKPKQAFGSFPIKEEIVTNETFLEVYKKYYKYTTTSNDAGDYMIFGVPTGTQIVHLSVDITDIGEYSMNPAAMVTNLGYSPNLFTDNNTRIKPSNDLGDLPHIETQEISVDIRPFWGDVENFEIGITRQDFRIRATLTNTFVMFGSVFTDGNNAMYGENSFGTTRRIQELFSARQNVNETAGMFSKRIGKVMEKIYYYPSHISDADINSGNVEDDCSDMEILDPNNYSIYKRNGDFVFIINCNRNKVVTGDDGSPVSVSNTNPNGIFTEFRGFVTLEITENELPMNFNGDIGNNAIVEPFRYRFKFPQYASPKNGLGWNTGNNHISVINWRKQNFRFESKKFYSFSRFHATVANEGGTDSNQFTDYDPNGFFSKDFINDITKEINVISDNEINNVGVILTNNYQNTTDDTNYSNSQYGFPSNRTTNTAHRFGANWMNLSIHFPQVGKLVSAYNRIEYVQVADHFHRQGEGDGNEEFNGFFLNDNDMIIAAGDINTKYFPRSDLHWTDIIEVPVEDIKKFNTITLKGFKDDDVFSGVLQGNYRNGNTPCPYNGGNENGVPTASNDERIYFYKGLNDADCIKYLLELGLVT